MESLLEAQFGAAMFNLYRRCKAEVYHPSQFLRSLYERGGLGVAKWYINDDTPTSGYTRLWNEGRLDLTVEAFVVENPEWHPLFTDEELAKARKRLEAYGYKVQG